MIGRRLTSTSNNANLGDVVLSKRFQYLKYLLESWWRRWKNEYLTQIREHKQYTKRSQQSVKKGEIVVVYHHQNKRNQWKLGKVEQLIKGRDGVVRAAEIKVGRNQIKRPITKLYPLEIDRNENCHI